MTLLVAVHCILLFVQKSITLQYLNPHFQVLMEVSIVWIKTLPVITKKLLFTNV